MTLTPAEIAFLDRAAPYIEQGVSLEDALRAVLARDQEIASISMAKTRTGEAIRGGLAAQVYHAIRGQKDMERAVDNAAAKNMNWR